MFRKFAGLNTSTERLQASHSSFDETLLGNIDAASVPRTAALYPGVDKLLWTFRRLPTFAQTG